MTAQPRRKTSPAPKGRNKPAQGNALDHAATEAQSPEGARQPSIATQNIGWRNTTLGAVITSIDTGKSFRCEERPPTASEVGVVKVSAVTWGTYDEEESKTCLDAARIEPRYLIEEGDFLFSRANTIQLIGACVIAGAPSRRLMLSDKILRFRFTDEVEPKWVLHWLRSKQGRSEIERLSSGNQESMRNIGQERIRAIALPLPPLSDQRRIVAEIEKQFTRLEAGVAALLRVKANLKRYRAAVLAAACEGRLVPTEAELARAEGLPLESGQQLLARILTARRQNWQGRGKYKEPANLSASGFEPGPLPEGWVWATVSEVSAVIVDCPHSTAKFVSEGHPCLDTTCMKPGRVVREKLRYVTKATFDERVERLVPEANDIVFAREGTVGTAVAIPDDLRPCLGQRVMLMRPGSCILPAYFQHCLNSETVRHQYLPKIVGSTAPHINVAEVKMLAIPLPPLAEQTRIVAEVERRLSVVEELEAVVTTNLQRATRLRQAILQKAFSGEL